jgi:hypothetical protein
MTDLKFSISGLNVEVNDPALFGRGPSQEIPSDLRDVRSMTDDLVQLVRDWWLDAPEADRKDNQRTFDQLIVAVCANGDLIEILPELKDDDDKAAFIQAARLMFREWKVERYALVSEAWKAPDAHTTVRPSQCSGRKEVMIVSAIDRNGCSTATLEMVRDWQSGCVVDLLEDAREYTTNVPNGRFMRLLEEPTPVSVDQIGRLSQLAATMLTVNAQLSNIEARCGGFGHDRDLIRSQGADIAARLEELVELICDDKGDTPPEAISEFVAIAKEASEFLGALAVRVKKNRGGTESARAVH